MWAGDMSRIKILSTVKQWMKQKLCPELLPYETDGKLAWIFTLNISQGEMDMGMGG